MNEVDSELERVVTYNVAQVVAELVFLLIAQVGKRVIGVANWLSPKVSNPEIVSAVELKGNARAKPRSEFRVCVRCNRLASRTILPSQVGLKV